MFKKIIALLILTAFTFPTITYSLNLNFDKEYIISDDDLMNCNTMGKEDIQQFLDAKGFLGKLIFTNIFGEFETAADIIYKSSKEFCINPKFILTTIQKEQSLVEDINPEQYRLDWATGFGVCDSCSKTDPGIQKYKGFRNQVYNTARINREYIKNPKNYKIQVNKPYKIDNQVIIPKNQATVNMYTYTPHFQGNQSFFNVWTRWFIKLYPDGTLIREKGKPGIWLIQGNTRRPFVSKSAFYSRYDIKNVIDVSKIDLDKYEIGMPIKFPNYSLLKNEKGSIYLLANERLKRISSWNVFRKIGFSTDEILNVKDEDLKSYIIDSDINEQSVYPTGAILQNKETRDIYSLEDGVIRKINSKYILDKYKGRAIIQVNSDDLNQFQIGQDDTLPEGTLISSLNNNGAVYVISNGEKREILSEATFKDLGFKIENIQKVDNATLEAHPLGFPIENAY